MPLMKPPENVDEIRSICKGGKFSVVNNILRPSSKASVPMTNVESDQPTKFILMIGHKTAML